MIRESSFFLPRCFILFLFSVNVLFPVSVFAMPDADTHATFSLEVLGLSKSTSSSTLDMLRKFSTAIDTASDLQGGEFVQAISTQASSDGTLYIVEKLPKPLASFEHRYFYHWGYNAVKISPMYRTKATAAILNKIEERVQEAWIVQVLSDDERRQLVDTICNAINYRWMIHKANLLSALSSPNSGMDLKDRKSNSALATLLYEMHILADYATSKSSLEPLGDFVFHVNKELIAHGLEVLFESTKSVQGLHSIRKEVERILSISPDPNREIDRVESSSFRSFFPHIRIDDRVEQRRALAILCTLRRHLPEMFAESYSHRLSISATLK